MTTATILRGLALQAQPRSIGRRHAVPNAPGSIVPITSGHSMRDDATVHPHESLAADRAAALALAEAEGHARGHEAGLRDGQRQIDRAVADAVAQLDADAARHREADAASAQSRTERFEQLSTAFTQLAAQRLDALQDDAVALAYEAVCQCIGEKLASRDAVEHIVAHRIQAWRGGALLAVRVNPADLDTLRAAAIPVGRAPPHGGVEWIGDAHVDHGGCILDGPRGSLDARMGAQLERLRAVWLEAARPAPRDLTTQAAT